MNYKLGLDIGLTSVGWGIIDNDNNIINAGVRLFSEANPELNQKRRARRASRRLLRRRRHRLERLKKLLFENKIIDDLNYDFYINETTPYFLRKKGLYEKLSNKELAVALFHLIKRRGAEEFSLEGTDEEAEGTKNTLIKNSKKLEDKYICEVQLLDLEKTGKVRGKENIFKTSDYQKEAKKILITQKELGNEKITDNFIEKYIEILTKRRTYYEGPGQGSPYGWENEEEWLNGLMGNCTYFPEELRMIKNSYTAELFNLLNDLNNLTIKRVGLEKLSKGEKEELLEIFKNQKSVSLKKIAKYLDVDEENISGYRIDTTGKALFTPLSTYITVNKIYPTKDRDLIDEIAKICTYYQDFNSRKIHLKELMSNYNDITEDILDKLAENKFSGTHSLSKKAMNIAIPEMLETSKNQMQIFYEKKLVPYKMNFKGMKNISKEYLDYWIVNPVVKKSVGQTINVINEILKEYGTPDEIVIEMMREDNSKEKEKKIKSFQKNREKINTEIKELLGEFQLEKRYFPYIKYWKEQKGKCIYSGDEISFEELIKNPEKFEIGHIIPLSISFDNSSDNKVLVRKSINQQKGQRSPYQYFTSAIAERTFENFKKQVMELKESNSISKKKVENLLLEKEITKYTNEFINRNLNDIRYITKEVGNLLKRFFIDNEKNVKIQFINARFTNYIRNLWKMEKSFFTKTYAENALILLTAQKILYNLKWVKMYNDEEDKDNSFAYYISTGEILDEEQFKKLFSLEYSKAIKEYKNYKYSFATDKKVNRQLMNETIYCAKPLRIEDKDGKIEEKMYIISRIKDIYDQKNMALANMFASDKYKKLLIYINKDKIFEKFQEVYDTYKEQAKKENVNPFYLYYKEHGHGIGQKLKNGKFIEIKKLKYNYDGLGSHFDISHKYKCKNNNKVIMLKMSAYRIDFYSNDKEYKFVTLRYPIIKEKAKYYEIPTEKYNKELELKGISENYKFMFSLYSGDIIEITNKEGKKEKYKFKGINDEKNNKIEVDYIDYPYKEFIISLRAVKEKIEKNPEAKISQELSFILQKDLNEQESREIIEKISLTSKQKIIIISKSIVKIEKKYRTVLGKEYQCTEKLKKHIKK